jgi:hypothetical protein
MKKNKFNIFALLLAVSMLTTQCKKTESLANAEQPVKPEQSSAASPDLPSSAAAAVAQSSIFPSAQWNDINGVAINAHGGSVFYEGGFYHWFGSHKIAGKSENSGLSGGGVHLYRSRDLINWNDFGIVMPVIYGTSTSDIAYGARIERPHVVYNASTRKYVCMFKLFLKDGGLTTGYNGVATSNTATGPYTYQGKFLAASSTVGSGDFTLFKDGSTVYLITVRKTDRAMVIGKLNNSYNGLSGAMTVMPNIIISTEAPCIFLKSGVYHLLGSGSTGWDPNPARYYTTTNLLGSWTRQGNNCYGFNPITGLTGQAKTFGGQPTDIIQIQGVDNQYIAMMDVWKPTDPINGKYIWLPFRVRNQKFAVNWFSNWNLSWFATN